MGEPVKVITNPVLDLAVEESMCKISGDQLPLKSALHLRSNECA